MKKYLLPATAALLFGIITSVFADDNTEKPIVVTATRTAQTADETLASVTVINRQDIERQQARSVQDLLRGVPGVNIANNGGPGKNTSVFMRGTNSDHVLILIDGIRAGSATSGGAAFENIPIEQIDRIEIVRGPRSSLYGSEAIGGVIQIFTRKGGGGIRPNFSFGGGSYGTLNGSIGLSGGGQQGWFNLGISGKGSRGFNACTGSSTAGCFSSDPDPDRDGYRNVSGSARAGYRFQNGLEIEANFLHSAGKTEFDGNTFFPNNKAILAQQVFGGSARFSPMDFWRFNLIAGRSRENSDNFMDKTFLSRFNTQRDTISLQNDFTLGKHQLLTIGTDYQNDHVDSTEAFTVTSRNNWGVFVQHQATISSFDLQLSGRHDDNQQFGSWLTGGASLGYSVTDSLRLTASLANAFKAPTFNDLFFPNFGNANLRPEKSRSLEFGVNGKTGWGNWSLNVYETRINNLIAFDADTNIIDNIDEARILGLEGILSTVIKGWRLNSNITFLDPENKASRDRPVGINNGNLLPRRAERSFRLDANRQFGKYILGAMLLAEGRRFDNLSNTRKLDSYVKVDLRAEYIINQNWRLQGRIENLFDNDYETAAFFNQPGRNFFATIRYQPSM